MKKDFIIHQRKNHVRIQFLNFYPGGKVKNNHIMLVKKAFMKTVNWKKCSNSLELFEYTNILKYLDSNESPAVIDDRNKLYTNFKNGRVETPKKANKKVSKK